MEAQRGMEQVLEWEEAQKIVISLDLLAAAREQLHFLAIVDRNRWLYEGPTLEKAIYRYDACWLPLLAKHSELPTFEGPLVVPLDCEWIWHCHRLNPVRYKSDCEKLYGRILDNSNVVSSTRGTCICQTEQIWNKLYPDEPYHFDAKTAIAEPAKDKYSGLNKCTQYDLVSAVKRQSPFFYQVSRPHMKDDIFIEEAVARYKGFLHLIKRNRERSISRFCVPTYDIDLIWHTHQLHPVAYCKDMSEILCKILEHDDTDSDRSKGKKLDVGFSGTIKQWEETFGCRYRKAGAMYRGTAPSPLTTPVHRNISSKEVAAPNEWQKNIDLPKFKMMEVLVEIVDIKNLPEELKGNPIVTVSKKQPDMFFSGKHKLFIQSELGVKQAVSFLCEPMGELVFELLLHSPCNLPLTKSLKTIGTICLSLQDFLRPVSKLAVERWVELVPSSGNWSSKPTCLRVALSFTLPIEAPFVVKMVRSNWLTKGSCFLPLLGKVQYSKSWIHVIDEYNANIISLQMRESRRTITKGKSIPKNQVVGVLKPGETHTLAELTGNRWSLMNSQWCLQRNSKCNDDTCIFELVGHKMIKFYQGQKLDFEPRCCKMTRTEEEFTTAVEFSEEDPYGRAVALFDLKSGLINVKEEWFVLPGIVSAFIISAIANKKGYNALTSNTESEILMDKDDLVNKVTGLNAHPKKTNLNIFQEGEVDLKVEVFENNSVKSGACGGGGQCGNIVATDGSGGCGSSCGSGCGNMAKSGGCGSGCGGGCGSGCGGGFGNMAKSSECGSSCGSGCGNMIRSGGCGAGCGSGCENMLHRTGSSVPGTNSSGCGGCGGSCGGKLNK